MGWSDLVAYLPELGLRLRRRAAHLTHRIYWDLRDALSVSERHAEPGAPRLRVLFVCHGNICRSPLAAATLRDKLTRVGLEALVGVDSAGTSAGNVGKRPHWKARTCARRHGLTISERRSREFIQLDFERFDHILVMDEANRRDVLRLARDAGDMGRVRLLLEATGGGEIPDPIEGPASEVEAAFRLIDIACARLAAEMALALERYQVTGAPLDPG